VRGEKGAGSTPGRTDDKGTDPPLVVIPFDKPSPGAPAVKDKGEGKSAGAGDKGTAKPAKVGNPPPAPIIVPAGLPGYPVLAADPRLYANWTDPANKKDTPILGTSDNSNTQFAILALWVAQRHGVPMERTLKLMVQRFRQSQNADGSWGYH